MREVSPSDWMAAAQMRAAERAKKVKGMRHGPGPGEVLELQERMMSDEKRRRALVKFWRGGK